MPYWLKQLEERWQTPCAKAHVADVFLRPLSALYSYLSTQRRSAYLSGQRTRVRLQAPTVVVGNVVAGGAGKTPVTMALTLALQQRQLQVGIISRGYGRSNSQCLEVTTSSHAADVGDEPLLIKQATGAAVFVATSRAEAGQALLAAYPQTDLIVCDDGLQHWALERDFELCVFPHWGMGNGKLLPAGPLRETWPRPVDAILQTLHANSAAAALPMPEPPPPYWPLSRSLAPSMRNGLQQQKPLQSASEHQGPIIAVAGIAKPNAFFSMLRQAGITPSTCVALPDHYAFEQLPPALEKLAPNTLVLCTEKDAVKLWTLLPQAWAVGLDVQLQPEWVDTIVQVATARYRSALKLAANG
ncbi:tetraacyldisaccharide 4'-kinase [Lampropedia puyangensis]|uniref:Tetraacyldisaccharide 4'-kinase n=1 Tax=Lampropedia puyangensis TaxID=1330072 RepID=A0A4S8FDR5_9BURK|nr:tetraacyldisaccharide 4'-kinase [Lampropedia puyangensis]THU05261.1 tetraacyldisaccharide 4'-kinase [Lampropedia puyangensis]